MNVGALVLYALPALRRRSAVGLIIGRDAAGRVLVFWSGIGVCSVELHEPAALSMVREAEKGSER